MSAFLQYVDNEEIIVCKNNKSAFGSMKYRQHNWRCSMPTAKYLLETRENSRIMSVNSLIVKVFKDEFEDPFPNHKSSCNLCHTTNKLTWHHIVPKAYMKYGPQHYRHKMAFNDIIMLCEDCHMAYETDAQFNTNYLLEKSGSKLGIEKSQLDRARSDVCLAAYENRFLIPDNPHCKQIAEEIGIEETHEFMVKFKNKITKLYRSERYNLIEEVCNLMSWEQIREFWLNDFNSYVDKKSVLCSI